MTDHRALLPSQLAAMRLGCRWSVGKHTESLIGAAPASVPANAFSRDEAVPRIAGQNDVLADCVETAAVNIVQTVLGWRGSYGSLGDRLPVRIYRQPMVAGYVPGDPSTDRGTDPERLFSWWEKTPIEGFRLQRLIPLHPQDETAIRNAIAEFGSVMLILALAKEQQNQRVWLPAGTPGSWGYHAMTVDEWDGALTWGTTWGEAQALDRSFFNAEFVVGAYGCDLIAA